MIGFEVDGPTTSLVLRNEISTYKMGNLEF